MASLREVRRKIGSIKNTQQITRAMKMVATARLRRAQQHILSARPFAQRMEELIHDLMARIQAEASSDWDNRVIGRLHPLLEKRASDQEILVIVTADKGLCGSFNTHVIRRSLEWIQEKKTHGKTVHLFLVGRKGRDFFRRISPLTKEYVNFFTRLSAAHSNLIGDDLIQFYLEKPIAQVTLIYQSFVSVIQQKLMVETLLPIAQVAPSTQHPAPSKMGYLYEPAKEEILKALLPRYLKGRIYRILLESYAAELGARMAAMESATKNAKEIIAGLTLQANKTRQAMITKEIAELVGSAEALN